MDKDDHIESFNRTALIIICEDDIIYESQSIIQPVDMSLWAIRLSEGVRVLEWSKMFYRVSTKKGSFSFGRL